MWGAHKFGRISQNIRFAGKTEFTHPQAAKKLFGRIGTVLRDRESERLELYRHTILAFETLRVRRALSAMDDLPDEPDIADFQKVFGGLDEVETAEYHKIARGRLYVIERFRKIAPDQKERVVHEFLFDHLWLLHPSWERPTRRRLAGSTSGTQRPRASTSSSS